jgi:hypothetical protein
VYETQLSILPRETDVFPTKEMSDPYIQYLAWAFDNKGELRGDPKESSIIDLTTG